MRTSRLRLTVFAAALAMAAPAAAQQPARETSPAAATAKNTASAKTTPTTKTDGNSVKPAKPAAHSTSGIVRSIDGTTLVIAKNAKATATETFTLTTDTARKGDITVGTRVGVRYTTESGHNTATAVTVSAKGSKIRVAQAS